MTMVEGTWITFRHDPRWSGITRLWQVETKSGWPLGFVKWCGRWRKYGFFPADGCVFEEVCMREISQFIVDRTAEHRGRAGEKQ
jgi:hypothetical protein